MLMPSLTCNKISTVKPQHHFYNAIHLALTWRMHALSLEMKKTQTRLAQAELIHAGLEYNGSLQAGLFHTGLADGSQQPKLLPSIGKYTRPHPKAKLIVVCHILVGRKWCITESVTFLTWFSVKIPQFMKHPCQEWWSNLTEREKAWNPHKERFC